MGPNDKQLLALNDLKKKHSRLQVRWDKRTGSLRLVTGLKPITTGEVNLDKVASYYLDLVADLFPSREILNQTRLHYTRPGTAGLSSKVFRQFVGDARVVGSCLEVQLEKNLRLSLLRSSLVPGLTPFKAKEIPFETAQGAINKSDTSNIIIPYEKGKAIEGERVIIFHNGLPRHALRYRVSGRSVDFFGKLSPTIWDYYVDRASGEVITRHDLRRFAGGRGYGYYAGKGPYRNNTWEGIDLPTKAANPSGGASSTIYNLEDEISDTSIPHRNRSVTVKTRVCQFYLTRGVDLLSCTTDAFGCACSASSSPDNNWMLRQQGIEVDCHYYSGNFFRYLQVRFNRVGVNDMENQSCIVCAHHNSSSTSESLVTSVHNQFEIVVPCGDGLIFGPFCAEDIIAHEWTHSLLDHEDHWPGSGWLAAMNESICDAMATFFKIAMHGPNADIWLLGKNNWLRNSECPALRCLSDPTQGALLPKREDHLMAGIAEPPPATYDYVNRIWEASVRGHQPDHWIRRLDPELDFPSIPSSTSLIPDNGWAHVNCGIINKAIFLMIAGGQASEPYPGTETIYTVEIGLGPSLAEQLVYQAGTSGAIDGLLPLEIKDLRDILLEQLWCVVGNNLVIPSRTVDAAVKKLVKQQYLLQLLAIVNAFAAIGAPGCKGMNVMPLPAGAAASQGMSECSPSDVYWSEQSINRMMADLIELVNGSDDPNQGPIFRPHGW